MVRMIMELVRNQSFTLTTGGSKQSRLRCFSNGVSQRSVLAPLLFNIYMYDLPSMISKKFAYADALALLHYSGNWKDLEGTLSQDMSTLSSYLQTCRLKLSHTKTMMAVFHLNNREAKRKLKFRFMYSSLYVLIFSCRFIFVAHFFVVVVNFETVITDKVGIKCNIDFFKLFFGRKLFLSLYLFS